MPLPIYWLINTIFQLITWTVIINAILSWLIAFDVVNRRNRIVNMAWETTTRLTDPLLKPIRRIVPTIGGIDLSPLVLLLAIQFLQIVIDRYFPPF